MAEEEFEVGKKVVQLSKYQKQEKEWKELFKKFNEDRVKKGKKPYNFTAYKDKIRKYAKGLKNIKTPSILNLIPTGVIETKMKQFEKGPQKIKYGGRIKKAYGGKVNTYRSPRRTTYND